MKPLRIGAGTTDGVTLCDHLARSTAFVVLEVADGNATAVETRSRDTGECGNHKTFVEMLEGCDVVLCGGIGGGAANSLAAHGIKPVVAAGRHSIADAVALYLEGKLPTSDEKICLCH